MSQAQKEPLKANEGKEPIKATEEKQVKPSELFPLTARGILEMCWGLTMNFSHEDHQVVLGKTFTDKLLPLFDDMKNNPRDKAFVQALLMNIFGTMRSLGFIRENHVSYLDYQSDRLTRKRQSLEQIGSLASFSGSGLYSKIASFIGVGSLADVIAKLNLPESFILPELYIPLFAAAGIGGAFLLTFFVSRYVRWTEDSWVEQLTSGNNEYWKKHFKPDVTQQLLFLFCQIKSLLEEYYPDEKGKITEHDELLKMEDWKVEAIISDEILPPDGLLWSPYIIISNQSATKDQVKPTPNDSGTKAQGK